MTLDTTAAGGTGTRAPEDGGPPGSGPPDSSQPGDGSPAGGQPGGGQPGDGSPAGGQPGGAPQSGGQPGGAPPAGGILDRPDIQRAGWVWGDADAQAPPLDAPLSALVSVVARLLGAFIGCTAQGAGISPAGLGVLRLLAARDGLKSSEVAARGWWTPGTVTSVVDTLVRDGYVERRREAADRRVVRLHLTGAGRQKVEEAVSLIGPRLQGAFGYVDPADEPVIRKFLVDTIQHFGTLIREERGK